MLDIRFVAMGELGTLFTSEFLGFKTTVFFFSELAFFSSFGSLVYIGF